MCWKPLSFPLSDRIPILRRSDPAPTKYVQVAATATVTTPLDSTPPKYVEAAATATVTTPSDLTSEKHEKETTTDTVTTPSDSTPPKHVEAGITETSLNEETVVECDLTDAPPPYTPSTSASYDHVIPVSEQGYQRFDISADNHVNAVALVKLGPDSCQIVCPSCGQIVDTETYPKAGALTFITATICFLFCVVCVCLPFCLDELQDVEHRCPNCKYNCGTFTRI